MSASVNSMGLPQGFSVFQPALGAQLQFFPAVGTQEHDDMMNAFLPGPATVAEKRASVALDFFEHLQLTGQTFKFYPVYSMTPVESPNTVSPLQDSGYGSSYNASPVMSSWDWSQVNATAAASYNPNSARQRRQSPKSSASRHQPTDFSHMPGMKIMTKDGLDVTNSASRGSKTKEQRDHAHLMRIIKACDSCRRKKIRCDPSHKKRSTAQAPAPAAAKVSKKAKTTAQRQQSQPQQQQVIDPVVVENDTSSSMASFAGDQSFAMIDIDTLAPAAASLEPWEEFIQYPPADLLDDYDFFADPEGYLSPQSSSSLSAPQLSEASTSAPSSKPDTPSSRQEQPHASGALTPDIHLESPQLPFNQTGVIHDYSDFNLYSPQSTFSEDDCMVSVEVSGHHTRQHLAGARDPALPQHAPCEDRACGQDELVDAALSSTRSPVAIATTQERGGSAGGQGEVVGGALRRNHSLAVIATAQFCGDATCGQDEATSGSSGSGDDGVRTRHAATAASTAIIATAETTTWTTRSTGLSDPTSSTPLLTEGLISVLSTEEESLHRDRASLVMGSATLSSGEASLALGATSVVALGLSNYFAMSWLSAMLSTVLLLAAFGSLLDSPVLSGHEPASDSHSNTRQRTSTDALVSSRGGLDALRCESSSVARSVGRMVSHVRSSIVV